MICWTIAANDWRWRLSFGVCALFLMTLLWLERQREATKKSLVDRQSVLELSSQLKSSPSGDAVDYRM
jgi:hypothetical protein